MGSVSLMRSGRPISSGTAGPWAISTAVAAAQVAQPASAPHSAQAQQGAGQWTSAEAQSWDGCRPAATTQARHRLPWPTQANAQAARTKVLDGVSVGDLRAAGRAHERHGRLQQCVADLQPVVRLEVGQRALLHLAHDRPVRPARRERVGTL